MSSKSSSSKKSEQSGSGSTNNANKNNKLFITSIDIKTPIDEIDKKLREMFQPFGEIVKIDIKKSYNNTYSFAFVEFSNAETASKVLASSKNCQINGKKISIDYQKSNPRERRNFPPRNTVKSKDWQPSKSYQKEQKTNHRYRDDDPKYQERRKDRSNKYSPSIDCQRGKKKSSYKDDYDSRRRKQYKKRSETPEYKQSEKNQAKHSRKEDRSKEKSNHKSRYAEECYNCRSTSHPTRDCPKNIDLHKRRKSPSSYSSDRERRERSRKSPKHPQVIRRNRREREKSRRYRKYSSDFSSSSSSRSYRRHRKPSKSSRKYDRFSSSEDSRRRTRYN